MHLVRWGKSGVVGLAATAALALGSVNPVEAVTVTYTTTGCFAVACPGPTTATVVAGADTATISFAGAVGSVNATSSGTGGTLGTFTSSATGSGATFSAQPFTLSLIQTLPAAGTGGVSTTLSGEITTTSNGVFVSFASPIFTLAGIQYRVLDVQLVPQSTTSAGVVVPGTSTLQARISVVPEPGSLALLGLGVFAVSLAKRRTSGLSAA